MNNMFNCPPMCPLCHTLHSRDNVCAVLPTPPEIQINFIEPEKKDQSIIIAAAYRYRSDGRIGILDGASIRGKGVAQLYAEDDIHWSWKGNLENFHFYWELVEPLRIRKDSEFWDQIREISEE